MDAFAFSQRVNYAKPASLGRFPDKRPYSNDYYHLNFNHHNVFEYWIRVLDTIVVLELSIKSREDFKSIPRGSRDYIWCSIVSYFIQYYSLPLTLFSQDRTRQYNHVCCVYLSVFVGMTLFYDKNIERRRGDRRGNSVDASR